METNFKESKTKENLIRAFAGESQARNRYTFAAEVAKTNKLHVIHEIFIFTANQEKEHAKIYYNDLKELSGENITVDGTYPVDIHDDVIKLLRSASHNEFQEYEHDYAKFSEIAKEEGFMKIANTFKMIAGIEKTHGERFKRFADMMEKEELFISKVETQWMCLNCGYIYTGTKVPEKCPVCAHDKGFFLHLSLTPFVDNSNIADYKLTEK